MPVRTWRLGKACWTKKNAGPDEGVPGRRYPALVGSREPPS